MLRGTRWLGGYCSREGSDFLGLSSGATLVSASLIFLAAVSSVHAETVSCQKETAGHFQCVELSMDGTIPEDSCWIDHKLVKSPCPTENLIATCTYEMGVSAAVGIKEQGGLVFGAVKPLKHQVHYYRVSAVSDEKRLEYYREDCRGLEGLFSTTSEEKK